MKESRANFWITQNSLIPTLLILANAVSYDIDSSEVDAIKFGLDNTSDEKDLWYDYKFVGTTTLSLEFARDEERGTDIIFIKLFFDPSIKIAIDTIIYVLGSYQIITDTSIYNSEYDKPFNSI